MGEWWPIGIAAVVVIVGLIGVAIAVRSTNLRRLEDTADVHSENLGNVKKSVENVHQDTQQLVKTAENVAFREGVIEERERADKADLEKYLGPPVEGPEGEQGPSQ